MGSEGSLKFLSAPPASPNLQLDKEKRQPKGRMNKTSSKLGAVLSALPFAEDFSMVSEM